MTFAQIRGMQPDDLDFAAACTAAEGWRTQTRAEFEGFYAHDPKGCLIAEVAGAPVGICVGTSYGRYGFVGELIVVPEMRGRDIGRRLLDRAVNRLWQEGARGIYLDAVQAAVPLYWRAGFRGVCCSLRFSGTIEGQRHADVRRMRARRMRARRMRAGDLDAVCALDRAAFGADRSFFLQRRWQRFPGLSQVSEIDGQIAGFALAARVDDLVAVGPWVVRPEVERPADLLEAIARAAPGCTLGLGVLESNPAAVQVVRELGLSERENPPLRMVLGPDNDLSVSPMAYTIGSPAKG
jgi:ribosomal protein S18 acetylase RimI-like enzyme